MSKELGAVPAHAKCYTSLCCYCCCYYCSYHLTGKNYLNTLKIMIKNLTGLSTFYFIHGTLHRTYFY